MTRDPYGTTVTPDVAEWVLYCKTNGRLGIDPGGFVTALMETIRVADLENENKLALGFPEFVAAAHKSVDELSRLARLA